MDGSHHMSALVRKGKKRHTCGNGSGVGCIDSSQKARHIGALYRPRTVGYPYPQKLASRQDVTALRNGLRQSLGVSKKSIGLAHTSLPLRNGQEMLVVIEDIPIFIRNRHGGGIVAGIDPKEKGGAHTVSSSLTTRGSDMVA